MTTRTRTRNNYPDSRIQARITDAQANVQLHEAMKYWRDEYVTLRDGGAIGLYKVTLTGDYMQDGPPCSAAVQRYRHEHELRAQAGKEPPTASESAAVAGGYSELKPSPTSDDKIAEFVQNLTPDEREFAAGIIDGVSSKEWFEGVEEVNPDNQ